VPQADEQQSNRALATEAQRFVLLTRADALVAAARRAHGACSPTEQLLTH
jgi:hypothetical protein